MKTKKVWSLLLTLIMAFMMALSVQAASKNNAYKSYLNWVSSGCKDEDGRRHNFNKFYLVRVDSDKIPELVAYKKLSATYGAMEDICVVSFKQNRIVTKSARTGVAGAGGFRGSFSFIPQKGKMRVCSWESANGSRCDEIYKLTHNGYKKIATANFSNRYDFDRMKSSWSYTWNEKKVSKKTLERKLLKAFNYKKAKQFTDLPFVSRSEIIAMLKRK